MLCSMWNSNNLAKMNHFEIFFHLGYFGLQLFIFSLEFLYFFQSFLLSLGALSEGVAELFDALFHLLHHFVLSICRRVSIISDRKMHIHRINIIANLRKCSDFFLVDIDEFPYAIYTSQIK
ncbi:hypothetical protein PMAYCL1PPCAC_17170, partial [Pristionchus mayeri]